MAIIFLVLIFSYLLGSVPFGLVITRLAGLEDIRAIGSGNIGATNVLRTGRKDLAALTLIMDAGKGAIAVLIAWLVTHDPVYGAPAGAAAFVGHCFPLYLRFKGGKGVATFFGTLLAINPIIGGLSAVLWLLTAVLFRMSSLAALIAAIGAPVFSFYFTENKSGLLPSLDDSWIWVAGMSLIIFWRHGENIGRILKGSEPRIGKKKEKS